MRKLTTTLFVLAVAAGAALSAFAADVPPPCAPVPVRKAKLPDATPSARPVSGENL